MYLCSSGVTLKEFNAKNIKCHCDAEQTAESFA